MVFLVYFRDGFDQERIDALLHKIELSQKHQSDKFGLHLGVVCTVYIKACYGQI